jgi:UDP-N-acetylmuramate dehydrogenase
MQILKNVSLQPYNTFGIDVPAEYFVELTAEEQLQELTTNRTLPANKRILGGGSNILLTQSVEGLLIRNCLKGITVAEENDDHIWFEVKAGEIWHDLVQYTIEKDLSGLENLSLIPGCVGAAPMQNIGAYGVEVKDTIEKVIGWHLEEQDYISLNNADCRFGYRDSIFKHGLRDKVAITSVTFRLNKHHRINTSYGAIQQQLELMGVTEPSVKSVSDAVIAIRTSKLPDPKQIGNAGSFFKNPTIRIDNYQGLLKHYPNMPSYPVNDTTVKVPAGWLIEQAGWKGYKAGDAGVHQKQALVLINHGNAKGSDILKLSGDILASIKDKFDIDLEREVNIW